MRPIIPVILLFLAASCPLFADPAARRAAFPVLRPAKEMVDKELLPQKGLDHPVVIDVMSRIPRHRFVAPLHRHLAYRDTALPIGDAQTISPPYVVAYMTRQLDPKPTDKVLEIGTGSGYQAAVLSLLVDEVYSIEIVEPLGNRAAKLLDQLGLDNVKVRVGDGYKGWPEAAPFDAIIVTCSPESVPRPLVDQLREGGRMLIPLGERYQQAFYLCKKVDGELVRERLTPALFVPMTGQAEELRRIKPDPLRPGIVGGGFEDRREDGSPVGWHYARNVAILPYENKPAGSAVAPDDVEADGKFFARFTSRPDRVAPTGPGPLECAQVLQGFAVDGRAVRSLVLEYSIRGEQLAPTRNRFQAPTAILRLFDETRNQVAEVPIGRAAGSFAWKRIVQEIPVPEKAREAVLLIGLSTSHGVLDVDHVVVRAGAILPKNSENR